MSAPHAAVPTELHPTDLHLTLVRHGATAWNESGRWQGVTDNPLAARGEAEAGKLARRLQGRSFGEVWCSDLQRAVRTAHLVLPGQPLILDPHLREMNFGVFEGLTAAEMSVHGAYAPWQADPWCQVPPGGESLEAVAARMQDWADSLVGGRVMAFSHSVAIRALAAGLFGWPLRSRPGSPMPFPFRVGHTSLTVLQRQEGVWTLSTLGDTAHLDTP